MLKPSTPHSNIIPATTVVAANKTFGKNGTNGGTFAAVNGGGYANLVLSLNVTAESGSSPTLSVQLQDSADLGVSWNNVGSPVTNAGTVATSVQRVTGPIAGLLRAVATVGGTTPSFTCSLDVFGTPS